MAVNLLDVQGRPLGRPMGPRCQRCGLLVSKVGDVWMHTMTSGVDHAPEHPLIQSAARTIPARSTAPRGLVGWLRNVFRHNRR